MTPTVEVLAPCVAIVGPANSGKSTLLNLLDQSLQLHPAKPLTYVVKGSPDGSGRYQHYSPELRKSLKSEVKGKWVASTVDQICSWVSAARQHLELALLDFGGMHSAENHRMLALCSHYIVLARRFPDAAKEAQDGADSWRRECESAGLAPIAVIESLKDAGNCFVRENPGGWLDGAFRGDAEAPGDRTNHALITALTSRLLGLRTVRREPVGIDLRLSRDWSPSDLPTLAGLLPHVEALAHSGAAIELCGRAPIWAYLAAMHRALSVHPAAELRVQDPKVESGWVAVPLLGGAAEAGFPSGVLQVGWEESPREGFCALRLSSVAADKLLPDAAYRHLAGAPLPEPPAPPRPKVVVTGAGPNWLHLAYSRWLRSLPGVTTIALWDARNTTEIVVGP